MTTDMHPFRAVLADLWAFTLNGFRYLEPVRGEAEVLELKEGRKYGPNDIDTSRIRIINSGVYPKELLNRSLSASEYALYHLTEAGYDVPKEVLSWQPGQWHMKLKGWPGVHIGVRPSENAVIEFFDDDGKGHLGVVTRLFADEGITVKSVGMHEQNVFGTYSIPKSSWQTLGPVFTTFTKPENI